MAIVRMMALAVVCAAALSVAAGGCASKPLPRTVGEMRVGEPVRTYGVGGADRVYRDGAVFIASQPDERAIRAASRRGVGLVVNVRTEEEMQAMELREEELVAQRGMSYVQLPMRGRDLTPDLVDRFAALIQDERRPVLLHCRSSGRAAMVWAAYLHRHRGVPLDDALALARDMGLKEPGYFEVTRQVALGMVPEVDPEQYPELFKDLAAPEAESAAGEQQDNEPGG